MSVDLARLLKRELGEQQRRNQRLSDEVKRERRERHEAEQLLARHRVVVDLFPAEYLDLLATLEDVAIDAPRKRGDRIHRGKQESVAPSRFPAAYRRLEAERRWLRRVLGGRAGEIQALLERGHEAFREGAEESPVMGPSGQGEAA